MGPLFQEASPLIAARPLAHPGFVAARWYTFWPYASTQANGITANQLRTQPFEVPQGVTIDQLGFYVSTAASGGLVQLAIYASAPAAKRPTGLPVAQTGSLSTTATGMVTGTLASGSGILSPGLYYACSNGDATAAATAQMIGHNAVAAVHNWLVGASSAAQAMPASGVQRNNYSYAQTFGTWPDLTGVSPSAESNTNGAALQVMRISAVTP